MKLSRRCKIRLILFAAAAIAVLSVRNVLLMRENRQASLILQSNYLRAIEDLSAAADNINNTLEKQLYAGTASQQAALAEKLFSEASTAKAAMLQLPIEELSLENTYKFLSQVGNYAQSIAEKSAKGEEISDDEYNNLKTLHEFADSLSEKLWSIEESISCGEIDISDVSNIDSESATEITEGFTDFEEGFESYPTLIYDGPFSDHIMEKEPLMTKDAEEVGETKALERASMMLNVSSTDLTNVTEQDGKIPCYVFSDEEGSVSCAVTKQGGYVSYFLKSRQPAGESISIDDALKKAKQFLNDNNYNNMKVTYYERSACVLTVNFAYEIDDITCYTDLVKVSVALDDGEILGFEANGYLVNHQKRSFPDDTISIKECEKSLSPYLECESKGKALIPTDGGEEIYCYEYKCVSEDGREVLVYFNAQTGEEEQILILLESEDGTLTM